MEKLKLLLELNQERLKEKIYLKEITREQSHRDFYEGVISELNRSIRDLEDILRIYDRG